jgi:hypothetical protein
MVTRLSGGGLGLEADANGDTNPTELRGTAAN